MTIYFLITAGKKQELYKEKGHEQKQAQGQEQLQEPEQVGAILKTRWGRPR